MNPNSPYSPKTPSQKPSDSHPNDDLQTLEIVSTPSASGINWLKNALALFGQAPILWMVAGAIIFFGLLTVTLVLASIAPPLAVLTSIPASLLVAGVLHGCKKQRAGATFKIEDLFYALDHQPFPLVRIGLLYALGTLVASGFAELIFWSLGFELPHLEFKDPEALIIPQEVWLLILLKLALNLALVLPLLMAYWFAPALVLFHQIPPVEAFKMSFKACKINMKPFLLYGLYGLALIFGALLAISILGALMMPLAILLILSFYCVAFSVSTISIYTAYEDIFVLHKKEDHQDSSDNSKTYPSNKSDDEDSDHFIV